jgi:phosphoribosylanthranilate isomerase
MTNLEDALVAIDAGADAVGFVFEQKSPRCVTAETVRAICEKLPPTVDKVGVFVNESPQRVAELSEHAGLSAVQFHGDEYQNPQEYAVGYKTFFALPVIGMLQEIRENSRSFSLPRFPQEATILLDSGDKERRGGTGKTFAWPEAHAVVSRLRKMHPVIIAGGLSSSNVAKAAGYLKPWGVDVSSGVEQYPGKKDPGKVRAFVRALREYDRNAG